MVGNHLKLLYSVDLALNNTVQNIGSLVFNFLSVHVESFPTHVSHAAQEFLCDSMLRVPVLELHPTVMPPKQRLTGQPTETLGDWLDIGEKVARRDVKEDML
jgi:hypothetical protein